MKILRWSYLWRMILVGVLLFLGVGVAPTPGIEGYRIAMRRNFGYGGGSQIRGDFTISVTPQEGVAEVTFFIDSVPMATVNTAPFRYRFHTGDYPLGWHEFKARITTVGGEVLETPVRRFEFVSAEVERAAVVRILVPLLGGGFGDYLTRSGSADAVSGAQTEDFAPTRGGAPLRCQRRCHLSALRSGYPATLVGD